MKPRFLAPFAILSASLVAQVAAAADKPSATIPIPDKGFVAHEWGTFTSVQGADGVQMIWNPFVAPELPKFVYDRNRPQKAKLGLGIIVAGKIGTASRQRMETPVIYFYSDRARTIDVSVKFPEGTVTEWYPQDNAADLIPRIGSATKPALRWPRVEILPPAASASATLPVDPSGSHYYAARETDASVLRVPGSEKNKSEVEKFLFYRGVAAFVAPLTVKMLGADGKDIALTNTGSEELRSLLIYEVRADGFTWIPMERLKPGETRTLRLDASAEGQAPQGAFGTLTAALVREGLYEREAAAMVKTWESSWFAERGVRVLYTLPRAFTDRILPLAITPAPSALERVMVARAEVITPEREQKLLGLAERYQSADATTRMKIAEETRALSLGRFIQPALGYALRHKDNNPELQKAAWEMYTEVLSPPTRPLTATAAK